MDWWEKKTLCVWERETEFVCVNGEVLVCACCGPRTLLYKHRYLLLCMIFPSLCATGVACKFIHWAIMDSCIPFCLPPLTSWAFMCVQPHVCRRNCKMQELYFFWCKGILPARIQEDWGHIKMHAHMLFTSASHPASLTSHIQTPGTWNKMAWSWEWAAVMGRRKTVMLSKAKCCEKAIMEDGCLLSMPALCLINID